MSLLVLCAFKAPDLCSHAFIGFVAFAMFRFTIAISEQTALFLVLTRWSLEPDDGALLNMHQARNGVVHSREQLLTYYGIDGETMWNEAPAAINEDNHHQSPQL